MNPDTLCMGCMTDKEEQEICPHCGFDENSSASPLALPLRTLLNKRYVVGRILGKPGGFGVTYLVWDIILDTRAAIKEFLPRELASRGRDSVTITPFSHDDGDMFAFGLTQFRQEAWTLARFDHPNIVKVKDFFEANHTAYMVMEYYEGISLDQYLEKQRGPLSEKLATDVMMPIMDGLREVHEKGFLHRDIKPANIYLTQNGRPILLDFGAARFAMGERSRSLSVVLSPGYAPLESYHRKGEQGPWTDIYGCGAVLYKMVTGQAPPEATERASRDQLHPPCTLTPGISNVFSKAVMNALAMNAQTRPKSLNEIQEMLKGTKSPSLLPPSIQPKHPEKILDEEKKRSITQKTRITILGILVTASFVGLLIFLGDIFQPTPKNQSLQLKQGDRFTSSAIDGEFVFIPPGRFQMGSKKSPIGSGWGYDAKQHGVTIQNGFYMQRTEVTQGQWEKLMNNKPSYFQDCGDDWPVENISYNEAIEFIDNLNKMEQTDKYRLPTEAEWEYACRAGSTTAYCFGDESIQLEEYAWYDANSEKTTHPVGEKKPNAWGLYDMHGNVLEWCQDWYGKTYYSISPIIEPLGPSMGDFRVVRGGSCFGGTGVCRSADRYRSPPEGRSSVIGFRLVLLPDQQ